MYGFWPWCASVEHFPGTGYDYKESDQTYETILPEINPLEISGVKFHVKSEYHQYYGGVPGTLSLLFPSQFRMCYFDRGKVGGIIWGSLDSVSAMTFNWTSLQRCKTK